MHKGLFTTMNYHTLQFVLSVPWVVMANIPKMLNETFIGGSGVYGGCSYNHMCYGWGYRLILPKFDEFQ